MNRSRHPSALREHRRTSLTRSTRRTERCTPPPTPAPGAADPTRGTLWVDFFTGERLSQSALAELRRKAHLAYEANTDIFEDEQDALTALGAVSLSELLGGTAPTSGRLSPRLAV